MKRKRYKRNKKPSVLAFTLLLISVTFYYYCNLNAAGDSCKESKISPYSEEPQKYIIVISTDENGRFLCESPTDNFCFYQGVYYSEKEIGDKLYTYFENEYREVVEADGGFFISEEKYSENLSLKVGERSKNRVTFFRNVYKKEDSPTKNERITDLIKYFIKKSGELNKENKVSFIFSDGSFTDFTELGNINEEVLNKLLGEKRTYIGDIVIKNKLTSLTENERKENISVIYFKSNEALKFTETEEFNFKNTAFINILSPADIVGKDGEKSEKLSDNFKKAEIFSESGEIYMEEIFNGIHKK